MAVHAQNNLLILGRLGIHVMDLLSSPLTTTEYKSASSVKEEELHKLNVKINTGCELNPCVTRTTELCVLGLPRP